jgi:hypothetical protein
MSGTPEQLRQRLAASLALADPAGPSAPEAACSAAREAIVAILPSNAVEDDRRELVACCRKVGFSNAAQNGAGGQCHKRVVLS